MPRPIEQPETLGRLGKCLRAGFTADNHESLGADMTRSMLHLSLEEKTATMRVRLVGG
ncbi:MAG TPA: hypothetical protein VNT79_18770 [Phycisphaerae bacterium]|nr:hypothetical protein [Phycisphaerae bacterium]